MVAIAFAIYAGLREVIGPAWAAAGVAGIVALLAVIVALVAFRKASPKPPKRGEEPSSLATKAFEFGRERPIAAVGIATAAAVAAVAVALKNPKVLTAIIAGFFAPPPPPKR